ncbi:MAG: hypothetical protein JWR72_399 [Flavisolibacter sp.]|jgi:hypothetical protein|nr:hypothetical protein [Flavisolibacter sp.]
MKKVLMVIAVAGFMASCNNEADSTTRTKDSLDSVTKATTNAIDSNANQATEKVENLNDSTKNLLDSTNKMKDSATH